MQQSQINNIIENAWLGLGDISKLKLDNPLQRTAEDREHPGLPEMRLMRNKDYLAFTVKTLLDIDLIPLQAAVLEELWFRPFPIYIASRGQSKSFTLAMTALLKCALYENAKIVIVGAAFRQSKVIFEYMESMWRNAPILRSICDNNSGPRRDVDRCTFRVNSSTAIAIPIGCLGADTLITTENGIKTIKSACDENKDKTILSNGEFRQVGYFLKNGNHPVKKIRTKRGYEYVGTYNHKMKVVRDNQVVWCRTDELEIGDNILIDRKPQWYTPTFNCDLNQAYCLGAMIGDGSWVNKYYLEFINVDEDIIYRVNQCFDNLVSYDNLHYYIKGKDIVKEWLDYWDLPVCYTQDKCLPNTILSAPKEVVASCISGLMDTDGGIQVHTAKGGTTCRVSFYNTSYKLVQQLQYILLHFGIISTILHREIRYSCRTGNKCKLSYELHIFGYDNLKLFNNHIGFKLKRKQDLLDSYLNNAKRKHAINSEIIPIDKTLLADIAIKYKLGQIYSPSNIFARKNITLNYLTRFLKRCYKKCVPENELYVLKTLCNADIYYDKIVRIEDIEDADTYDINVPDNSEYRANGFFSHNTGEKIRGLRANVILADEFNCLSKSTLIETDDGLKRIQDLMSKQDFYVVNKDGKYEKPQNGIVTPPCDVYQIETINGDIIECSENHIVMTQNGWKKVTELSDNDYIQNKNYYKFPVKEDVLSNHSAYKLGQTYCFELLPNVILQSSRSVVHSFLAGFFNDKCHRVVKYRRLANEIQILLHKLEKNSKVSPHGDEWSIELLKQEYSSETLVKSVSVLTKQEVLYDFYLPETHSFYGNGFVQHNSIPPDIYETVIAGFAAVSADPVSNMKEAAKRKEMAKLGIWTKEAEADYHSRTGNQAILSGTAGFDFQHFHEYWKRYCAIIRSKGDKRKLAEILRVDEVPDNFNWKDYSVIRIPYEFIPEGFMDDKVVSRARATMNSAIYNCEYGCVFSTDSDGFFKRSLIERCVADEKNNITLPKSGPVEFDAQLAGSSAYKYVFGIDPASERDNFSIIILELREDHTRIVYGWSTNRKDFKRRIQAGLADKYDFYGFCARKIRALMKLFPCDAIAMDAQGGGVSIEEALHDPDKMTAGETAIWPIIERDRAKDTDILPGQHILHLCQFAKADWTAEANHGLRKDFEDRVLLFPRFDTLTLELSAEEDGRRQQAMEKKNQKFNMYDTLEDCVMELEELKEELSTITLTRTGTGVNARDRWDTPEIKKPDGKKGRLRKDRYSALVMANMIARNIHRARAAPEYSVIGGFTKDIKQKQSGKMYNGPEWFTSGMNSGVVHGISRRG